MASTDESETSIRALRVELANMVAGKIGQPKIKASSPTQANSKKAGKYLNAYFCAPVRVCTIGGYLKIKRCIVNNTQPEPHSKVWASPAPKQAKTKGASTGGIRDQQREWFIKTGRWIDSEGNVTPIDATVVDEIRRTQSWAHPDLGTAKYKAFYSSRAWLELRYFVLRRSGGKCDCCGASSKEGAKLQVDHIKPRSRFPALELDPDNLQTLCGECNQGKGAWGEEDWR